MWTGALALVSWAGEGMPWAVIGETGERLTDNLDMLRPSCQREGQVRTRQCYNTAQKERGSGPNGGDGAMRTNAEPLFIYQ